MEIKSNNKLINQEFKKDPKNLKYKYDITEYCMGIGDSDIFEVYTSYKDNREYIAFQNYLNIEIYSLLYNEKIISLEGHNNHIRTIRYFINKKKYSEYLITGGNESIIIIWDITNDYKIKYKIDTNFVGIIISNLLIFPINQNDDYIVTSSIAHPDYDKSSIKIYSFNTGNFIRNINEGNNKSVYYLLEWQNKKDNNYYIIQFLYDKILIKNLLKDKLYAQLGKEQVKGFCSGFVFIKDCKEEYLCTSSTSSEVGNIVIWNLYNKTLFKIINIDKSDLHTIIQWNNKYFIAADYKNNSFHILDIDENKIVDKKEKHYKDYNLKCVKKILLPKYVEALICGGNHKIELWTI